jgi:branched-chain amino acid transport system permease protein
MALLLGLAAAPMFAPSLGITLDMACRILVWGIFGLGFDILFGHTGLLSFGQSAFFGTGGFVVAWLVISRVVSNCLLALALGVFVAAMLGLVIGFVSLRTVGIYFAMITVAFGQMFYFLENSPLSRWTGGENGLPGIPRPEISLGLVSIPVTSSLATYYFIAAFFFVGFWLARRVVRSPFGAVLCAIRENNVRAAATGHAVNGYRLAAFAIAAAYGGLAGGLLGYLQGYMPPDAFSLDTSGQLVIQDVIGGAGTLIGPLVGASIWIYLRDVLQEVPGIGNLWKLVLGIVFVALVTLFRRGICGELSLLMRRKAAGTRFLAREAEFSLSAHATKPSVESSSQDTPVAEAPLAGPARLEANRARSGAERETVTADVVEPGSGMMAAIEARELSKHYGGLRAVDKVTLSVAHGEVRALIGPNGAGKTTLLRMLAGEIRPNTGDVYLLGERITGLTSTAVCHRGLNKTNQVNQLFPELTVYENLVIPILARRRGRFRLDMLRDLEHVDGLAADVERMLAAVGLGERAWMSVSALSYGDKRHLELGLALATDPRVLLLDEPLAGLSPAERREAIAMLQRLRQGRTLVIVEHDMDAVFTLADSISVLHGGRLLAQGSPDSIQRDPLVQQAYLGGAKADELA